MHNVHGGGCVNADCDAFDPSCSQCGAQLGVVDRPADPRNPWACSDCLRLSTLRWLDRWAAA